MAGGMRTVRTSVRRLVEFLLRRGDIDAGRTGGGVEVMQAGSDVHRTLQASAGGSYQAEVSLMGSIFFPGGDFSPHAARLDIREEAVGGQEGFFLCVEGRADGIIDDGVHQLVIDEIKGTVRDVSAIEEADPLHEAQALCYAYLYLRSTRGPSSLSTSYDRQVTVRITYASMTTGEVRQIERAYFIPDIEAWFFALLEKAQRWAAWRVSHDEARERSLSALAFPFTPREGQQETMDAVASAIHEGRRLYLQAPTGSGKTVATLYPALKAMGAGEAMRVFYLTAKTMARTAALECLDLFRQQGLAASALAMTARDKICPLRRDPHGTEVRSRPLASLCNPVECPLARGHYDVVNDALFEAITAHDVLDSTRIGEVATRHHVCPYELQRDAARWSDVIVCDYHYAFAPSASLIGLADEPCEGDTVFLVDEAHNLAERMRDMYSAELDLADLQGLERILRTTGGFEELAGAARAAIAVFPQWEQALPARGQSGSEGRERRPSYQVTHITEDLSSALTSLADGLSAGLEELLAQAGSAGDEGHCAGAPAGGAVEVFLTMRDLSFRVLALLGALQRSETGYVTFLGRDEKGGRRLTIFCVDPSHDLEQRLEQAKAAVFFSGTLLPMDYHRRLLAAREDDASVYARSSFDPRHLRVLIGSDISARYSQRGPKLYARIASYLAALVRTRPGNYLVFLPSYAMMGEVGDALAPLVGGRVKVASQQPGMREDERERFVARFREPHAADESLVGLCVLGGFFGESINLPGESLVGVTIVGTGLPRASDRRELIRDHFDAKEGRGFAYAYTYPGMSKVLQAAGRLIRTEEDRGVVLLLDDRFLEDELRQAFPKEWEDVRTCTLESLPRLLART